VPRKKSGEVTRAYVVTHWQPGSGGRGGYGDPSKALAAARALRRKGVGKVLRRSASRRRRAAVVVVLKASPRRHREALAKLKQRAGDGISVQKTTTGGTTFRSAKKGQWVHVISCQYCGVGVREAHEQARALRAKLTCKDCARKTPLELLVLACTWAS
jgi:hypothetical protein